MTRVPLSPQVTKMSAQLEDIESSANEATDLIESEQLEKREMEDQLAEAMVSGWALLARLRGTAFVSVPKSWLQCIHVPLSLMYSTVHNTRICRCTHEHKCCIYCALVVL